MTLTQVQKFIRSGQLENSDLDLLADAVRYARSQLTRQAVQSFRVGTTVKFHSPKNNKTFYGRVDKVGRKYLTVNCGVDGRYRVPGSMLNAWESV